MEFLVVGSLQGLVEMGVWCVRWCVPLLVGWLALVAGFLVYFYLPCWGVRRVPGPPFTPIVGHLPLLAKFGPDVLRALAKEYGPIFRFHMGRQPLVIVADPELCREVGIRKFKNIKNRSIPSPSSGSSLHEKGLFMTKDSRWSSMRNAIIPFYQPTHLATLIPAVQSIIESATRDLASIDGDLNLSHLSLRMAIDVIGRTAFDVDFGLSKEPTRNHSIELHDMIDNHGGDDHRDDDVSGFLEQHIYSTESLKMDLSGSLSTIVGLLVPFLQKPCRRLLRQLPWTVDHRIRVTNESLVERIERIVTRKEKERGRDFLSAILNARDAAEGAGEGLFTKDYVNALAYEHLLAGSATTAFTVSSAVYLLCMHPHVERKLVEEIDWFGPVDRVPTAEDLQSRLPYLDQVVKEVMRYYTVSPLVARETSKEIELGGYTLPEGTWVWLALGVLAKDPKNFHGPNVFRPERFDPTEMEDRRRHPYAHLPFGLGPRTCIGQKFAVQEIKLTLFHLYRHYAFKLSSSMKVPPELEYGMVLNFKHGIIVRVEKRVHGTGAPLMQYGTL